MKMKISLLAAAALASALAVGCSPQQEQAAPAGGAASVPAEASAPESAAHLVQQDIRVIAPAPAPEGAMSLYHAVGNDAVEAVTPMADGEAFSALVGPGDHDVTLTQDACAFEIEVEVKSEADAAVLGVIKLSQKGERSAMLPGSDLATRRVTTHMVAGAENNYGCNLLLRKKL